MRWPIVGAIVAASLAAESRPRFVRTWWFEPGMEHGNPMPNRRFRVNAPEAVLHPSYGKRSETKSSGMLQIRVAEDLAQLEGAELYLELWGGHPGTANKRVTPNGRTTYAIPEVGTAAKHCTHQYPVIPLKVTDLVDGYNAIQFACDQGSTFWGHFIVDNAALRTVLKPDHPDLAKSGLKDFRAQVRARPRTRGEGYRLTLDAPPAPIARVDYQGFYEGYDENGDTLTSGWHGFTKEREPVAWLGSAAGPPYEVEWDTSMLPAQRGMRVRALVRFREPAGLAYETADLGGLEVAARTAGVQVKMLPARDIPAPFWSRAKRLMQCAIDLDVEPARIERAELHIVTWDGGRGEVERYFTLNGLFLPVAGEGRHDVLYKVLPVEPARLRRGANQIELLSDTEHHGIEVLLPGPALVVRYR